VTALWHANVSLQAMQVLQLLLLHICKAIFSSIAD
jgi:hypothetical protein